MSKTFEELKKNAEDIRTNQLPESNTATLVGGQLVDMVEMQEAERNERIKAMTEANISVLCPTSGYKADGSLGGDLYDLDLAITTYQAWLNAQVPAQIVGGAVLRFKDFLSLSFVSYKYDWNIWSLMQDADGESGTSTINGGMHEIYDTDWKDGFFFGTGSFAINSNWLCKEIELDGTYQYANIHASCKYLDDYNAGIFLLFDNNEVKRFSSQKEINIGIPVSAKKIFISSRKYGMGDIKGCVRPFVVLYSGEQKYKEPFAFNKTVIQQGAKLNTLEYLVNETSSNVSSIGRKYITKQVYLENGGLIEGKESQLDNRIRTKLIVENSKVLNININEDYLYSAVEYDNDGLYLSTSIWDNSDELILKSGNVRFVIRRVDNEELSVDELSSIEFIVRAIPEINTRIENIFYSSIYYEDFISRTHINVFRNSKGGYYTNFDIRKKKLRSPNTYYISSNGNDDSDGKTPNTAFLTFKKARDSGNDNDTIVFLEGLYESGVHFESFQEVKLRNLIGIGTVVIDNKGGMPMDITKSTYIENIEFINGRCGSLRCNFSSDNDTLYAYKCKFNYSIDASTSLGGLRALGGNYYLVECEASYNEADGFNYHISPGGSIPNFTEINCKGFFNGAHPIVAEYYSNNGSTAHDGAKGIRLNCQYGICKGGIIADVNQGTITYNFGCKAHSSTQVIGNDDFCANIYCGTNAVMYLYDVESFGSKYDISVTGGGVVNTDTEYDSVYNSGGTVNILE
ncbi:MAG: hypothetical protein ACRC3Z_09715 [Phocaeicola sp.]